MGQLLRPLPGRGGCRLSSDLEPSLTVRTSRPSRACAPEGGLTLLLFYTGFALIYVCRGRSGRRQVLLSGKGVGWGVGWGCRRETCEFSWSPCFSASFPSTLPRRESVEVFPNCLLTPTELSTKESSLLGRVTEYFSVHGGFLCPPQEPIFTPLGGSSTPIEHAHSIFLYCLLFFNQVLRRNPKERSCS